MIPRKQGDKAILQDIFDKTLISQEQIYTKNGIIKTSAQKNRSKTLQQKKFIIETPIITSQYKKGKYNNDYINFTPKQYDYEDKYTYNRNDPPKKTAKNTRENMRFTPQINQSYSTFEDNSNHFKKNMQYTQQVYHKEPIQTVNSKSSQNFFGINVINLSKKGDQKKNPNTGSISLKQKKSGFESDYYGMGSVFKLKKDNLAKYATSHDHTTYEATKFSEKMDIFKPVVSNSGHNNLAIITPPRYQTRIIKAISTHKCTYIQGKGNNDKCIKRVLDVRGNWSETERYNSMANLTWMQSNKKLNYSFLSKGIHKQFVNHLEFHNELSNKRSLIKNLQDNCSSLRYRVFNLIPLTFEIRLGRDFQFIGLSDFEDFFNLLRNKNSAKAKMNTANNLKHQKQFQYLTSSLDNSSNIWILKPTDFNRGRGIEVFKDLNDLKKIQKAHIQGIATANSNTRLNNHMSGTKNYIADAKTNFMRRDKLNEIYNPNGYTPGSSYKDQRTPYTDSRADSVVKSGIFLIQKYIERPALYKGRKFDIRTWVQVTHTHDYYVFKESYLRLSSNQYDVGSENINDKFVHLTNNAIQKLNKNYGYFEDGNILPFSAIKEIAEECNTSQNLLTQKIKNYINLSLHSMANKLDPHKRKSSFEILGYDFMIDIAGQLWLIEINSNPCLEESNDLLAQLVPRMIHDTLKLTIDQAFPPIKGCIDDFPVKGYSNDEQLWEKIGNLDEKANLSFCLNNPIEVIGKPL